MSRCARCIATRETTVDRSSGGLCPEHALAVLEDVHRQLATTLTSLARATHRAGDMVASSVETAAYDDRVNGHTSWAA